MICSRTTLSQQSVSLTGNRPSPITGADREGARVAAPGSRCRERTVRLLDSTRSVGTFAHRELIVISGHYDDQILPINTCAYIVSLPAYPPSNRLLTTILPYLPGLLFFVSFHFVFHFILCTFIGMESAETSAAESERDTTAKPRVGRPRKYDSPADRVRAHRERVRRRREEQQLQESLPATPADAATDLRAAVDALRTLTAASIEQHTAVATRITAALDKLADPAAVDAQLQRSAAELAKVRADADAKTAKLREQLSRAVDDRDNADAAVDAVDRELADARDAHTEKVRALEAAHHDELARIDERHAAELARHRDEHAAAVTELETTVADLRATVATQQQQLGRVTAEHDRLGSDLDDLRELLTRTESDVERARAESTRHAESAARATAELTAERERVADLRDALEAARVSAASAQAAETAARERLDELRGDLTQARDDASAARRQLDELRTELGRVRAAAPPSGSPTTGSGPRGATAG